MNKQQICLMSLVMIVAAAMVAGAEEINSSIDPTLNNTTINNMTTSADINQTGQIPEIADDANSINASNESSSDKNVAENVRNLSIVNGQMPSAVSISEIAKNAPTVAAVASSAQVFPSTKGAYKLGSGIGGLNPFNPQHKDIESLKVGIPIKPMRDTSKMFFVCDIV